jgi:hypothetical protein
MKNNFSRLWKILSFIGLAVFFAMSCLQGNQAQATSNNQQHELGVYSLFDYEADWKVNVEIWDLTYESQPEGAFWDLMTGGISSEYAYHTSRRRVNSEVNYRTIFPIPGDGWKDWDSFDLVFFFGHSNMITPPHPCGSDHLDFWSNSTGVWEQISGQFCEWGTTILPFEYYIVDVVDGPTHPSSVIYLHEPYTSALIGNHQFNPDYSWPIQFSAQDTPGGNSARTFSWCRGGLGTNDLEWLILHGCQAVIVADEDGIFYNPIGVEALRKAWDGFHIILGCYRSFGAFPNDLSPFADGLRTGVTVQAAYFLVAPDNNSSAISGERLADLLMDPTWFYLALRTRSIMNTDTWTSPRPDLDRNPDLWYVKWIRSAGTSASHWTED